MFTYIHHKVRGIPTPLAGLSLGIASLGSCLENTLPLQGAGQMTGAVIATILLSILVLRFILHFDTLHQDLKNPVIGSIVPTFTMAVMVISKALERSFPVSGQVLWLAAVVLHLIILVAFVYHRVKDIRMHHMVPSWFVPPVGIIVADVTCPANAFTELALILLGIGMVSYVVMLPLMIYRFIFCAEVPDTAKPTIAIMAAPASLSLAGYLSVVEHPSLLICAVLLGIALLMTVVIYCAFFHLLQLPFSPGYAAFTFPMAIGATALYKMSALVQQYPIAQESAMQLYWLATIEVVVATLVISYVSVRYINHYFFSRRSVISST